MIRITLTLLLVFSGMMTFGQNLKVMSVAAFEAAIPRNSDTLYVLNFWATWCGPCVKELPHFTALDSVAQAEGQAVKVVLVSLDFAGQEASRLMPFLQKRNIDTEVWFLNNAHGREAKGWIDRVSPTWSGAIPATLLVGGGQQVYSFKEQVFTHQELFNWVAEYTPESD